MKMNSKETRNPLLCLSVVLVLPAIAACSSSSTSVPAAPSVSQDPREYATCADNDLNYKGLPCFDLPLGISLGKFRELVASRSAITEESTKFPSILRKYSIKSFPGAPMVWNASAHFVLDGDCYRLYTIDGFSSETTDNWVRYFSKKFGRPRKEGIACIWSKAGTKLRVLDGDQPLISFTHDKFVEVSSEKMADAMDRGDYVH